MDFKGVVDFYDSLEREEGSFIAKLKSEGRLPKPCNDLELLFENGRYKEIGEADRQAAQKRAEVFVLDLVLDVAQRTNATSKDNLVSSVTTKAKVQGKSVDRNSGRKAVDQLVAIGCLDKKYQAVPDAVNILKGWLLAMNLPPSTLGSTDG